MRSPFPHSAPVALALAIALGLGLALPAGSHARRPGGKGARLERALEKLALAPETRSAALAEIDAARPTGRELRSSLEGAREGLRALLEQPTPSEEAILAQVDTLGAFETEMRKHELRTVLRVLALLTPEQRAALRQELEPRHEHRRERDEAR